MRSILRLTTVPVLLLATVGIAVALVMGLSWLHGKVASGFGQGDCQSVTNLNRTVFSTPGGGAGQQLSSGVPGPPASSTGSPSVPALAGGRVLVTMANNRATLTVPVGTVIDVELTSGAWSLPVSSDPQLLPRLSSSSSCEGVRASFQVQGSGWIEAEIHVTENVRAPDITFRVNVVTSP